MHVRPSLTQVLASALAAVSAAVVSSTFGVAGTLIGAAVASVIASVGSTLYLASLRNTNERLRRLAATRRPDGSIRLLPTQTRLAEPDPVPAPRGRVLIPRRWLAVGVLTIMGFGIAIGAITAVEAASNRPVSLAQIVSNGGSAQKSKPAPSPSAKPTPSAGPTATPSPSATPSSTVSGSPTTGTTTGPSATPSPTGSGSTTDGPAPTPTPSAAVTPGSQPSPSATPATVP